MVHRISYYFNAKWTFFMGGYPLCEIKNACVKNTTKAAVELPPIFWRICVGVQVSIMIIALLVGHDDKIGPQMIIFQQDNF